MGKAWFTEHPEISMKFEDLTIIDITDGLWVNIKGEEIIEPIVYGEKVRIKLKTNNKYNGNIKVTVIGKIGITEEKLPNIKNPLIFNIEIKDGEGISKELFFIDPKWYKEELEEYDYVNHKTIIKSDPLTFTFKSKSNEFPKEDKNKLIPTTYRRNYEELIGLHGKNGNISKTNNYENNLIQKNSEIKKNVNEFINKIDKSIIKYNKIKGGKNENKKKSDDFTEYLIDLVRDYASKIWEITIKDVQKNNFNAKDDRPLYWARNKMQTYLKRHPLYKEDYNLETSEIYKGTALETIIRVFEEKSRNYTDIDFSNAGTRKKILLIGFDPFSLNKKKFDTLGHKTDNQNPSGISALHFHGEKGINNAYIQSAIVPIRYEDFDNGIIEKIISNKIDEFDMIFTLSLNKTTNFDIERFASKFRGSKYDNMVIGDTKHYVKILKTHNLPPSIWNKSRFKQLETRGEEFYETTLKIDKILVDGLEPSKNIVFYDQSYISDKLDKHNKQDKEAHPSKTNSNTNSDSFKISQIKGKSTYESGSGDAYLSNEIMYRALRVTHNKGKKVGHLHIANNLDADKYLELIEKIINNATKK